jgi:integrase
MRKEVKNMAATHQDDLRVVGHLEEKRGIFQMILSWKTPNNTRDRKSISTGLPVKGNKAKAKHMLRLAITEKENELLSHTASSSMLFTDFIENIWLIEKKKHVKIATIAAYSQSVKTAIVPWFGPKNISLGDLTAEDINDFINDSLKRVTARTVKGYCVAISSALKYAVEECMLEYSVMLKVKKPKAVKFTGNYMRRSEIIELCNKAHGHLLEFGIIAAAFYGLRRSEIIGLKWRAIDFEANTISIKHTVVSVYLDGKVILAESDTTKSKSSNRTLPLVPMFSSLLLSMKEEQRKNKELCGNCYDDTYSEYIYVDKLGKRVDPNYISHRFPPFLEKHGFVRMRFHDLRHSCASLLFSYGVQLKQIQEWLGHGDIKLTADTYGHLEFQSKLESAAAMEWVNEIGLGADIGADIEI